MLEIDERVLRDIEQEAIAISLVGGSNSCCIAVCHEIADTIRQGNNILKIKFKARKRK
jgi:hypothetical protein